MKKVFSNSSQVECVFTDDGVSFCGPDQIVYYPYGCIDALWMSLFGVLQAGCRSRVCTFAVNRADRAQVKEAMRFAKKSMSKEPQGSPEVYDRHKVDETLSADEQLQAYKEQFIQGAISKGEYDAMKRLLK